MRIEAVLVVVGILLGVGATLVMDLWNLFLKRAFNIPSLNYCMLGRWVSHMRRGRLRHANIATSPREPMECAVGWVAHYSIGMTLATAFVLVTSDGWLVRPTLLPGLLYGIGTIVFPFFILQPSLGMGLAASRTAHPAQARLKSLATHTVFGLGLYLVALGAGPLLRLMSG